MLFISFSCLIARQVDSLILPLFLETALSVVITEYDVSCWRVIHSLYYVELNSFKFLWHIPLVILDSVLTWK